MAIYAVALPPLMQVRRFFPTSAAQLPPNPSLSSNRFSSSGRHFLRRRQSPPSSPTAALNSDQLRPAGQGSKFHEWDSTTAKFAGASNLPFLLIQLPQILLNSRNLLSGNKAALLAVPWLGMLTGLMGNLTLLSYFVKKREKEAVLVQTLGVVSIYVVIAQLAMAEAMPLLPFIATSVAVASGLLLNFLNYFGWILPGIWQLWEDFITIAGLSVLPQARTGKLPEKGVNFIGSISGWTATLLFMWMPIAQMWTNHLHPDNIKGLSAFTMLLGMIGNSLMLPRALFIRDLMWFTGASWASVLHGWGNLVYMYCFKTISWEFFLAATVSLFIWLGITLWKDTTVYGYNSPVQSLKELVSGR